MSHTKLRVLFLCTGNSCRSQMAEALLRNMAHDQYEALSAGSKPAGFVHQNAIRVMREIGIDLSSLHSKSINEFLVPGGIQPDLIISVCSGAEQDCPTFPGVVQRQHWPFDDPADATGTAQEQLAEFVRVRDEIQDALRSRLLPADNYQSLLEKRRSLTENT